VEIPLQITLRGVGHSAAVEAAIRERAAKLEQFHGHIISCRVVVELPARHKHKGKEFVVRIDLRVAGGEIAIHRDHSEDVYVALREAFDAAQRQLEDFTQRRRGDVKQRAP